MINEKNKLNKHVVRVDCLICGVVYVLSLNTALKVGNVEKNRLTRSWLKLNIILQSKTCIF